MSYKSKSDGSGCLLVIAAFVLCLPLFGWFASTYYKSVVFDIHCNSHLKRAADSNTVEMAEKELEISIKYLEDNKLTEGYTSVLWQTPQQDIKFWYTNLKSCHEELAKIHPETTQLEKTNVLMKLRETLLDHGKEGKETVTEPDGIEVYPNNVGYFYSGCFFTVFAAIGFVLGCVGFSKMTD